MKRLTALLLALLALALPALAEPMALLDYTDDILEDGSPIYYFQELSLKLPADWRGKVMAMPGEGGVRFYQIASYEKYAAETGDDRITVIASTASPFKFTPAVLSAIDDGKIPEDGFEAADKLSAVSGMAVPAPLAALKTKEVLHKNSIAKEEMADFIRKSLA